MQQSLVLVGGGLDQDDKEWMVTELPLRTKHHPRFSSFHSKLINTLFIHHCPWIPRDAQKGYIHFAPTFPRQMEIETDVHFWLPKSVILLCLSNCSGISTSFLLCGSLGNCGRSTLE